MFAKIHKEGFWKGWAVGFTEILQQCLEVKLYGDARWLEQENADSRHT